MSCRFISSPFLRLNEWAWRHLPAAVRKTSPAVRYGRFLHVMVQARSERRQFHGTFFVRNRPELNLLCSIANRCERHGTLKIGIVACSNGAEVYSIVWAIRSVRPDLNLVVHALDISSEVIVIAREGLYPLETQDFIGSAIFERLTDAEMREIFDRKDGWMTVKSWLREGIQWHVADAGDPELARSFGRLDIVVANKFLCHMDPRDAETCLRKVARLVKPGGYLFVSGVDLDVRTRVAVDCHWNPVPELLEEIHDGDPSVRRDWPWRYWGLEPFDRSRKDWRIRYASVFKVGSPGSSTVERSGRDSQRVSASIV